MWFHGNQRLFTVKHFIWYHFILHMSTYLGANIPIAIVQCINAKLSRKKNVKQIEIWQILNLEFENHILQISQVCKWYVVKNHRKGGLTMRSSVEFHAKNETAPDKFLNSFSFLNTNLWNLQESMHIDFIHQYFR